MKLSRLFWLGLIVSLAVIGFILGFLYLQDISLKKSNYTFTVIFDNVRGLNQGANVTMLGKQIGRVTHTQIIGKQIAVELSIDNEFSLSIPIDSPIEVRSEGILGEKYIYIIPGKNAEHKIKTGDTLQGTMEFDFSEISPGIVPLTQDLGAFARRLKATLGEAEKERLQSTIENIDSLSNQLNGLTQDLRNTLRDEERANIQAFLANLKTLSDSLKDNLDEDFSKIDKILDDVGAVTAKSGDLTQTIDSLKTAVQTFSRSARTFQSSVEKLNTVMDKLDTKQGTLPRMLNDDTVYENLDSLITDLRWVVDDFKENPGKYLKAYIKAKKD